MFLSKDLSVLKLITFPQQHMESFLVFGFGLRARVLKQVMECLAKPFAASPGSCALHQVMLFQPGSRRFAGGLKNGK